MSTTTVTHIVEDALRARLFPGCVVGVVGSKGRTILPFGTYAFDERSVTAETVYDVASVTKSVVTASLILMAASRNLLTLDDSVRTHLPELQNDRGVLVRDLLLYRTVSVRMSSIKDFTAEDIYTTMFREGFSREAGAVEYTNAPAYFLGLIAERVLGKPLRNAAQEYVFDRFHMKNSSMCVSHEAVPTEIDLWRGGEVQGVPHDESAWVFAKAGRAVGHAGLFSNAPDILSYLEHVLGGGADDILHGAEKGLGFELNKKYFMGDYFGPRTFGKTGFTGTAIIGDRDRRVGIVLLSNRTFPTRPSTVEGINQFRRALFGAILADCAAW